MTNKDYDRLTYRPYKNDKVRRLKPDGEEEDFAERLYELENAIENGTLRFLPCKVGDEFWWIGRQILPNILIKEIVAEIIIGEDEICIVDGDGVRWCLSEIYFTEEAAEKALEKIEK